jgi:hypothetical protein
MHEELRHRSVLTGVLLVLAGLAGLAGPRAVGQTEPTYSRGRQDLNAEQQRWQGQDLHVTAGLLLNSKIAPGQHLLLCQQGFTLAVAGRQYASRSGLVWISAQRSLVGGGRLLERGDPPATSNQPPPTLRYQVQVYLTGRVTSRKAGEGRDIDLTEAVLERDKAVVVKAGINGEIFVTAEQSDTGDPRSLPLYREARAAFDKAGLDLPPAPLPPVRPAAAKAGAVEPNKPAVDYTINIAPLTDITPKVERTVSKEGEEIITFIGRTYVWWEQPTDVTDRPAEILEVEADSLVLWRRGVKAKPGGTDLFAAKEQEISDIYVTGNIVFRQGQRTIYADNLYYDLQGKRAVAHNVVLKTFDPTRGVPIYVKASRLRQMSETQFEGEDIVLTTSEFAKPQLAVEAALIRIDDRRLAVRPGGIVSDNDFEVELKDVRFRYGGVTVLALPRFHANQDRPDLPIRSIHAGYGSAFGASLETRWYLNRLLGLQEPAGTSSTLEADYYSKRGPGVGVEIDYERENYFGTLLGYTIYDHGEDRLSRTRKDVDVPDDLRGRFLLQHRQYLPYGWQLTAEASYLSDENFLEQFYRTEYNVGKEQETLLYLKRIQDNWGLAFLGKVRINDFMDQVEELPSAEYHLTGQSLFDDLFTFYSDSQVSNYRYRFSPQTPEARRQPDNFFLFTGSRNELDLPLTLGRTKIVPFVAGTFGYDDGLGFHAALDEEPAKPEDAVWIGEGGVRVAPQPYWAVYPEFESRLWDLHQMRHIIAPTLTAVKYVASDVVAKQRDILDLELVQQWQTKRGPAQDLRTVNWIEWNTSFVWVSDSQPETAGPDQLIWNAPFIPLVDRAARVIPPIDRRATGLFGPRQDYIGTDAILRLTDTTSLLGDAYFGMQTSTIDQTDFGFSRLLWPDLSYYVGLRYLRRFYFGDEERSSNTLTFAVTYILDPRYTLVFSDQYDYGVGQNIATEVTLIRKYHRMNLALTFSLDGPMDEKRIVLGLWPEGIPELALGLRRYMEIGSSDVYR